MPSNDQSYDGRPDREFLRNLPRRGAGWARFAEQHRDELLGYFAPGRSIMRPERILLHREDYDKPAQERIHGRNFVLRRADDEIALFQETVLADDFIVVPRFRIEVILRGPSLYEIDDLDAYKASLAEAITERIAYKFPQRKIVVDTGAFRSGSIEFFVGIGFGAALISAFGIIKDYPNFKKGCKEIASDVGWVAKRVTKRFRPNEAISVQTKPEELPPP